MSDNRPVRAMPSEPPVEAAARKRMEKLLATTPLPSEYLIDNLALYLRRHQLADLLGMDALYRMIVDVPGIVMEFGVLHGRHLATLTALRGLYEPHNSVRRIVGFDTFTGFPDISDVDRVSDSAVVGRFAVGEGGPDHLREVLATHESTEPHGHVPRSLVVEGDVADTVPAYLHDHPETIVALAYFDLDLYEPTRVVLEAIRPHLFRGSVLAFDELGHQKWPGETVAVMEALGLDRLDLRTLPGREPPITYAVWGA